MNNFDLDQSDIEKKSLQVIGNFVVQLGYVSQNAYDQFCSLYCLEEQNWDTAK